MCIQQFTKSQKRDSIFIENTAFQTGETIKYNVKYGLIKGGEASMSINLIPVGYSYAYHVKAVARTTGVIAGFVKIRDIYESMIDIETGYPIKAIRNIREQKYTYYNEVLFDRKKNVVVSLKSGEHKVPPNTLDILSAFYYARRYLFKNKLKKNDIINMVTFFDDEIFLLKIRFKKIEKVKTRFGKIKCMKFVPVIEKGSSFKKESDLRIWVSNDKNFIPVRIRVDLPVSQIKVEIIDFSGTKNISQMKKK